MKFAIVEGHRQEAAPALKGQCPHCNSTMVAKCGTLRVWHWSHQAVIECDRWWEPETEWHRDWKNKFPIDWQEKIQWAVDGEKHIADVKTARHRVIEFQNSSIKREERRAREAFYEKMVWVVNGLRRKRDKAISMRTMHPWDHTAQTYVVASALCALTRDWLRSDAPVFFDFGGTEEDARLGVPVLWRLSQKDINGLAQLRPIAVTNFMEWLLMGAPLEVIPSGVTPPPVAMALSRRRRM